ncbi:MAG: hypothetical protein AB7F43_13240 [Bacteriovoracia bacterium]
MFIPPHVDYHTIQTENFEIIFPNAYEEEARVAATYLEEGHKLLSTFFKYSPSRKIFIVLADNFDFANGVTTVIGHDGIVLLLTAPDPYYSIGEYDNWYRFLIFHEYAHYLTLDQTNGLFDFLRPIFGDLVLPNALWPSILAEGFAVYAESKFTKQGRGHGTYYETITRDAIAKNTLGSKDFLPYNVLYGDVPDFPFGETAYYAGFALISEMASQLGQSAVWEYPRDGGYTIPFFINSVLTGLSKNEKNYEFSDLYDLWIQREKLRFRNQISWLKTNGTKEPEFLTSQGSLSLGARISPDAKKIAYTESSGHHDPTLYIEDLSTRKRKTVTRLLSGSGLGWSKDSSKLYFSKVDYYGPYRAFGDLYEYNEDKDSTERLTWGERAKDPSVCGDREVVYTVQTGRKTELRIFDLETKKIQTLYKKENFEHISTPRCSMDGTRIYFAEHSSKPFDRIYSLDRQNGLVHLVVGDDSDSPRYGAIFPDPLENGDLLFTHVQDGFFSLAKFDSKTKITHLIARSSGGYWTPSHSGSLIAVSYLSSTGIRVALLSQEQTKVNFSAASKADSYFEKDESTIGRTPQPKESTSYAKSSYSIFDTLGPRFWYPHLSFSALQRQLGLTLLGWDSTDQFQYEIDGYHDSLSKQFQGGLTLSHRLAGFTLAETIRMSTFASAYYKDTRYGQDVTASVVLSRPFPKIFYSIIPRIGGAMSQTRLVGNTIQVFPKIYGVVSGLKIDTRRQYRYSVAVERGFLADLSAIDYFTPGHSGKVRLEISPSFAIPPTHSSIYLKLVGATTIHPGPLDSYVKQLNFNSGGSNDVVLRGFRSQYVRAASSALLEYRVPAEQLFRGPGSFPFFVENYGLAFFYNAGYFRTYRSVNSFRSSGGLAVLINTLAAYNLTIPWRIEFARGFQPDGESSVFLGLNL